MKVCNFILLFLLVGCEYNSNDPVPGYIRIDEIDLVHEEAIAITDAWVYVDGNMQGVYELPIEFPIIAEGLIDIRILPGIKVNGISGTRSYYPFYEPYDIQVDIRNSEESVVLSPISAYVDWADRLTIDDFEKNAPQFENSDYSDTSIYITQESFEGNQAGVVYLDEERSFFEAYSLVTEVIPDFNDYTGMFLEMNYKGTEIIEVGLVINGTSGVTKFDVIYLYPTVEWKKIYIDLYAPLIGYTEFDQLKIYIASQLSESDTVGEIYFDDIKMVH